MFASAGGVDGGGGEGEDCGRGSRRRGGGEGVRGGDEGFVSEELRGEVGLERLGEGEGRNIPEVDVTQDRRCGGHWELWWWWFGGRGCTGLRVKVEVLGRDGMGFL